MLQFSFSIFIYNDGILTIIAFSSIFAQQSLGFQLNEIFILFALVQASAFIGSIGFGILTDKIGAKKTITITLLIWIFVVGCSFCYNKNDLLFYFYDCRNFTWLLTSIKPSLMGALLQKHEAEFLDFMTASAEKHLLWLALFFGLISCVMNDQRLAVLSVGVFLLSELLFCNLLTTTM